jgi:CRP/FNR family cyclic AMP-dependent transcriptional regulator
MKSIADELAEHPFFADLPVATTELIAGCGRNEVYPADTVIAAEGSEANEFFVIRRGRVAVQLHAAPTGTARLQTLDGGDILGWSWLFPPYRWSVEAKALQEVHAIKLDGRCLRGKCEDNPAMGYELMKRFSHIMTQRLEATRLQLLDLYGQSQQR